MKWLIILFIVTWLWCTACEKTYDVAKNKIENKANKVIDKNKDSIKRNATRTISLIGLVGHMTRWRDKFK